MQAIAPSSAVQGFAARWLQAHQESERQQEQERRAALQATPTLPPARNPRGRPVRVRLRPGRVTSEQRVQTMRNQLELHRELRERDRIRPRVRSECWPMRLALYADGPDDEFKAHKPCPFVGCKWHLHADILQNGTIVLMPGDIAHTCVLDVVDAHPDGLTREEIATVCRVSEERTRIFERRCERLMRENGGLEQWRDHGSEDA